MVLNLSAWLNICSSNRPFANERRSCWPIACIYFMKNLLLCACRTSTFEIMNLSAQKTRHVNGPSATTKPNAMHAFSFCQLSRDASESLGSVRSSSCSPSRISCLNIVRLRYDAIYSLRCFIFNFMKASSAVNYLYVHTDDGGWSSFICRQTVDHCSVCILSQNAAKSPTRR